jgi:RNA polymerase sigma-70 factor (ECF subfamily)
VSRPRPRIGHGLDDLAELRAALGGFRVEPGHDLTRHDSSLAATHPLPGQRSIPAPAETPVFESTPEGAVVMDLVARAQAGDGEAFGQLYDRYVDLVYRYVYYRVGTQSLAEDLVSETFLRALRRIGSFSWQGRDFAAWLVTIARNLIADHFKSGRYRLEVATADMLEADRAQDGPEGEVLDSLTNATLLDAVKQLNSEQQECVVLRFLQGMSVTETALAMGKTEGAIKALQYRAVRALGRMLPKELVL